MTPDTKKCCFCAASIFMVIFSCYCALAILQAANLFTGEKALFNLRFWGFLMCFGLIASVVFGILAARIGKSTHRK